MIADMKTVYRIIFDFHRDRLAALDRGDPDFAEATLAGVETVLMETGRDPVVAVFLEAVMADLALQSSTETCVDLWRRFTERVNRELESLEALEDGDGQAKTADTS